MNHTTPPTSGETADPETTRGGMPLHTKILLGLAIGAMLGIAANVLGSDNPRVKDVADWVSKFIAGPVGRVFLNMLFMVVVPLVFCSLALGVAQLGDISRLGRIGAKTMLCFLTITALSTSIGLILVNVVRPGVGFSPETRELLMTRFAPDAAQRKAQSTADTGFGVNTFVNIVPRNPFQAAANNDMLAIIFVALVFGIALTMLPQAKSQPVVAVLDGISEAIIRIVGFAMNLAPYAVAALIFSTTAQFGWTLLSSLLWFAGCVLVGLAFLQFVVYPILLVTMAKTNPIPFFRKITPVMVTAFSTSSSNATLPTTLKVAETELNIPPQFAGFVLPLGATMNMNGTALFEGVVCVFLAQVFGVDLSMSQQLVVVVLSVLMAVGTAGVPGGSIPLLMIILATIGVPPDGIAIILGVDRILDMARTVPNVTGDLTVAAYITRTEQRPLPA